MFSLFKLFENKENVFSYKNKTKTNFENKENEFTIFNILYMNQKTGKNCFPCFRIKSKIRDFVDWVKMKTPNSSFLLFIPLSSSLRLSSSSPIQARRRSYELADQARRRSSSHPRCRTLVCLVSFIK